MGIFGTKKEDNKEATDVIAEKNQPSDSVKASKKSAKKTQKSVASVSAAYGVVGSPIITEKSHRMAGENKYTFRVEKNATKKQIKGIIEEMYKVTVENVHVIVVKPKRRTVKYDRGYQQLFKKAIVKVQKGQHIAVFEGV